MGGVPWRGLQAAASRQTRLDACLEPSIIPTEHERYNRQQIVETSLDATACRPRHMDTYPPGNSRKRRRGDAISHMLEHSAPHAAIPKVARTPKIPARNPPSIAPMG